MNGGKHLESKSEKTSIIREIIGISLKNINTK